MPLRVAIIKLHFGEEFLLQAASAMCWAPPLTSQPRLLQLRGDAPVQVGFGRDEDLIEGCFKVDLL